MTAQPEPTLMARRVLPILALRDQLVATAGPVQGRPVIVGIDGRSSSGKTSLAARMAGLDPATAVVHSDDIAWFQARFDWAALLADGVLRPARAGGGVRFRPPAWQARGRPGSIEVPPATSLLLVEGVGVARRALAPLLDAVVWVTSRGADRHRRELARIAAGHTTASRLGAWLGEEDPFQADQRSWERADVIIDGTPSLPHDVETEVVVGRVAPAPPAAATAERGLPFAGAGPGSATESGATAGRATAGGATADR